MSRHASIGRSAELERPLKRIAHRLRVQRLLRWALWSVPGALAVVAFVEIAPWTTFRDVRLWVGLALATSLLAVTGWRMRPRVGVEAVARIVDERLAKKSQVSTALEVPAAASVVAAALHRDAVRIVRSVDPVELAPWRWPRGLLPATLACAFLAVGASQLPGDGAPWRTEAPSADASGATPLDADDGQRIRQLADAVASDAERRRDPYLEGISEQLRDLGDRIDRGVEPHGSMRQELDDLLNHLGAAYGSDLSGAELAERLVDRSSDRATNTTDPGGEGAPVDGSSSLEGAAASDGLEEMVENAAALGEQPSSDEAGVGSEAPPTVSFGLDTLYGQSDSPGAEAPPGLENVPPPGPGAIVGAAEEASAGASQLAGRGSQALEGDTGRAEREGAVGDVMTVQGEERDEGRRIEVELPSSEGWGSYDAASLEVGDWSAATEALVVSETTAPSYRPILGRYFKQSHATDRHEQGGAE